MVRESPAVKKVSARSIPVVNPATEEAVGEIPDQGTADIARAVARAKKAWEPWRKTPAHERAQMLEEVARRIEDRAQNLARISTLEGGKPLRENVDEMGWSASCFDYYAGMIRGERGRVIPSIEPSQLNFVVHEPYGIIAAIVPWNYPILLMAWKLAPALAAGNTVVLKPAEQTPLSTLEFRAIFDCLPKGVVEIVTGRGETAGEALVRHPDISLIAFTGSLETGRRIARLCSDSVKKTHLELGGKDAFVVCEDSDLEVAAKAVAWAAFLNAGQVCTSTERVYVHCGVHEKFLERLSGFCRTLVVGDGFDPKTDVGPMMGDSYRRKAENHVAEAIKRGAQVLCGGQRPAAPRRGYFYEPTVLSGVDHSMAVMREETFGPVCPVMAYKTFDEALALVNDSPYGLGANLYTHDARKVKRFFEEIQAGTIWINDPLTDNDAGPFGGFKATGGGRELGEEGLREFQQAKHVHWDFEQQAKPWWYPYAPTAKNYDYGGPTKVRTKK
ncbi:MAG TPA: aldehyde dehydrogenase family protein [Elusimicrobiota bacterium]|nr:aldehyde dehydrogenase family protein [Elusimicrobiota bacterium]